MTGLALHPRPVALLVGAALALLGCEGDSEREVSRVDDSRLAEPGRASDSPSGRHKLEIVEGEYGEDEGGGRFWRVRIRDASGEVVLDSQKRVSARFATLALWDERVDRAWLYSSDVGTSYFEAGDGGRWEGHSYGPERLARAEPPVPRELLRRQPESFGPEAREKARRLVRRRSEERSREVVCRRTPDGRQTCERRTAPDLEPSPPTTHA